MLETRYRNNWAVRIKNNTRALQKYLTNISSNKRASHDDLHTLLEIFDILMTNTNGFTINSQLLVNNDKRRTRSIYSISIDLGPREAIYIRLEFIFKHTSKRRTPEVR